MFLFKEKVMSFIGNGLLHLGWAFFCQQCDCGTWPSFNWLARLMPTMDHLNDEEMDGSWQYIAGDFFVDLAQKHFFEYL